jgi:predicted nuclease with TOPRIM domain
MADARHEAEEKLQKMREHIAKLKREVDTYHEHLKSLTYLQITNASTQTLEQKSREVIEDKTLLRDN